jgi:diacylglycerol kinase family enzyme
VTAAGAPIPVFLNASAGPTATDPDRLQRQLGAGIVEVHTVAGAAFRDAIADAVQRGAMTIGVAGGDGSLHAAASAIAGTRAVLLPVPTGTLNNFAKRVGIASIDDAATALRDRHVHALPVGTVNDRIFLNTLTFGEYSRIVRIREHYRRRIGKWPAAGVAFAIAIGSLRRIDVTLTLDDHTFTRRTPFVWIGVGWGSFPRVHEALERRSRPDLEVAVLRSDSKSASLAFMLRLGVRMARRARPIRDTALEILHTRSLVLDAAHRIDATADGEVLRLQPPVSVSVRDDDLRVLLGPRTGSASAMSTPTHQHGP